MPDPATPRQRSLQASAASLASWANTRDPSERTAPARAAFMARFERQVDPDGVLPDAERARRADAAMRSHMASMALASSRARARRARNRDPG